MPRGGEREAQDRRGEAGAATCDDGTSRVEAGLAECSLETRGRFQFAVLHETRERQIARAGHVAGAQPDPRFGRGAREALGGAHVDDLRGFGLQRLFDVHGVGDQAMIESGGEMGFCALRQALLQPAALPDPLRQAAFEDRDVGDAEHLQRPPQARRGEEAETVVDHRAHAVAKAKFAQGVGEGERRRQHMRQIGGFVGDAVDVEKHRARDVALDIFRVGVAPRRRHMPGGVENDEIGLVEPVGEPFCRDEKRFRIDGELRHEDLIKFARAFVACIWPRGFVNILAAFLPLRPSRTPSPHCHFGAIFPPAPLDIALLICYLARTAELGRVRRASLFCAGA